MRRAGVLLFVLIYAILVAICFFLWSRVRTVMKNRKEVSFQSTFICLTKPLTPYLQLLKAISIALPFLAVRTVYSVLSTFSSSTFTTSTTSTPNDSDLAKFNLVTGEWQLYLVMDMLMEYAVVILYTVAGLMVPLDQDYKPSGFDHEEYPLSRPQYY